MKLSKEQRGSQLVEFALIIPILILLFLGIIEFGVLYHKQIEIDNGVREAGRVGSLGYSNADVIDTLKNECAFDIADTWITITVTDPEGQLADSEDRTPGSRINIHVALPLTSVTNLPFADGLVLHAGVEYLIE